MAVTVESLRELVAWCVAKKKSVEHHDAGKYRHLQQSVEKVLEIEERNQAVEEAASEADEE